MKYIIGIHGSVTNGGKTTLSNQLIKNLPNCCVVYQDDCFGHQDQTEAGFKHYDIITALDVDAMMSMMYAWLENHLKFDKSHSVYNTMDIAFVTKSDHKEKEETHILLYTYRPSIDVLNHHYFTSIRADWDFGEWVVRQKLIFRSW